MSKTTFGKSLHLADTPQLGKCRKSGQNTQPRGNRLTYTKSCSLKTKHQERRTRKRQGQHRSPPRAATKNQREQGARAPTRPRGPRGGRTNTEKPQQGEKGATTERQKQLRGIPRRLRVLSTSIVQSESVKGAPKLWSWSRSKVLNPRETTRQIAC